MSKDKKNRNLNRIFIIIAGLAIIAMVLTPMVGDCSAPAQARAFTGQSANLQTAP